MRQSYGCIQSKDDEETCADVEGEGRFLEGSEVEHTALHIFGRESRSKSLQDVRYVVSFADRVLESKEETN